MSAFRNIIARRRPSGSATSPEGTAETEERTAAGPADAGTWLPASSDMLEPDEAIRPPRHARPRSGPAPNGEVLRWEIEPPRRTIGETVRPQDEGNDDGAFFDAFIAESVPEETASEPSPDEQAARIWDLDAAVNDLLANKKTDENEPDPAVRALLEPHSDPVPDAALAAALAAPAVAAAPGRTGRMKTRLLGFHSDGQVPDPFSAGQQPPAATSIQCPAGFLAIVEGPGFGASFALPSGLSTLGRGADQTIALDFGDDTISRSNHASIAYDEEDNKVLIGHGGKSNLVRLNGKPLVSSTELSSGDRIRIGKTTLLFVALCDDGFSWTAAAQDPGHHG